MPVITLFLFIPIHFHPSLPCLPKCQCISTRCIVTIISMAIGFLNSWKWLGES